MNNKNNKTRLQFTKLTQEDVAIQEDLYINLLLVSGFHISPGYGQLYYNYAIVELQKANELFIKEFG